MSVRVVKYRTGGFEVDIRLRLPNGQRHRERRVLSHSAKSAAQRWGQDRERYLLLHGPAEPKKEVPTLEEFQSRFVDGYARANRQKPSGIAAKETILKHHLVPLLGGKKLDAITSEDVQRLKAHLGDKAPKTVNNVLTVLNVLLKQAVEWDVIERLPPPRRTWQIVHVVLLVSIRGRHEILSVLVMGTAGDFPLCGAPPAGQAAVAAGAAPRKLTFGGADAIQTKLI